MVPQRAEPPANLKVTLLPFQMESLYWMRNQEQGTWKGGILAVRGSVTLKKSPLTGYEQDEMGYVLFLRNTFEPNHSISMGKTIQMIALLVSDVGIKPNLVVAYVLLI